MRLQINERNPASETKLQRVQILPIPGATGPTLGEALHYGIRLSGPSRFEITAVDEASGNPILSADHWSTMEEAIQAMADGFLLKDDPKIRAYARELIMAGRAQET